MHRPEARLVVGVQVKAHNVACLEDRLENSDAAYISAEEKWEPIARSHPN